LDTKNLVWEIPYTYALSHTVEEIESYIKNTKKIVPKLKTLSSPILKKLDLPKKFRSAPFFNPRKMTLSKFIRISPFVFLGLHGGIGEDGTLQKMLEKAHVLFNGSPSKTAEICMDKFRANEIIQESAISGISSPSHVFVSVQKFNKEEYQKIWKDITKSVNTKSVIVKPRSDGCSTGITRLYSAIDLSIYMSFLKKHCDNIPAGVFKGQNQIIEMPTKPQKELLFEAFIETDKCIIEKNKLLYIRKSGWIEVTIGILEKNKKLHAFSPSLTVSSDEVLSLEEKFQGGTGVNITPPPERYVKKEIIRKARQNAEKVANLVGIKGYARIDAFLNVSTGELQIIEVNTLPGLTPSTVIYHQALKEKPPLYPRDFIEKMISNRGY